MQVRHSTKKRQSGFSLIELLIVIFILMVVSAALFSQLNQVQARAGAEYSKVDLTQESREFMDLVSRDLRQSGYPTPSMYSSGVLGGAGFTALEDHRVAAGITIFSPYDLQFQGDVDSDGVVEVVRYTIYDWSVDPPIIASAGTVCNPCAIWRSQVPKVDGAAQATVFSTVLDDLDNAAVFSALDANSNPTTAVDKIKTIQINLRVMSPRNDLQTRQRPSIGMSALTAVGQ